MKHQEEVVFHEDGGILEKEAVKAPSLVGRGLEQADLVDVPSPGKVLGTG